MYNLDKICVRLDDTKFGFSFSDIKKNYTVIDQSSLDGILQTLRPYIDSYLLPKSEKPDSVRREDRRRSQPVQKAPEEVHELTEIEELTETVELPEAADIQPAEELTEIDWNGEEGRPAEAEQPSSGPDREDVPDTPADRMADAPEAFPDFEISDGFGDDDFSLGEPIPEPMPEPIRA